MKRPAISILTPTFNRAHVLHRVYDNLKGQKTCDFECVVADDGSTDDTPALLERWQEEADFPIGWYRYENNRGRNAAVNSGATLVSGDYTLILDSDDELLDDALETFAYWREHTPGTTCAVGPRRKPTVTAAPGVRLRFPGDRFSVRHPRVAVRHPRRSLPRRRCPCEAISGRNRRCLCKPYHASAWARAPQGRKNFRP